MLAGGVKAKVKLKGKPSRTHRFLRAIALCFILGTLTACVPGGEQNVNTELFKNKEEMQTKTEGLKTGMSKKAVFEKLGVPSNRFEKLGTKDMQMYLYGNAQVQGTPEQLESFRKKIASYEAYSLPYREIRSSNSIGFGKMRVEKTGCDLKLMLLFESGRLIRSSFEGTEDVKQTEEEYLWKTLFSRGIGLLF